MAAAHLVPYKDEDSGGEDRIADPGIEAGPGELGLAQADSARRLGIGRAAAGGEVAECGRGGPERHGPCSRLVSVSLSSAPTCALFLRRERHESGHCSRPVVRARRRRAGEGRGSLRSTGSVCGPRSRSGGSRPSTGLRLEDEHAADQSDPSAATGRRTVVVVAGTVRSTCRLPPSSSTARAAATRASSKAPARAPLVEQARRDCLRRSAAQLGQPGRTSRPPASRFLQWSRL
jgi:hypothetical protein